MKHTMKNILFVKILSNLVLIVIGVFIIFILGKAIYELEFENTRSPNTNELKSHGSGIPVIDFTQESENKN